jgi:LPS sulfotransferase NodH
MSSKFFRRKIRRAARRALRIILGGTGNEHRINVAMIHVGRCGSTVLCRMLSNHENIHWAAEFFDRFFKEGYQPNHSSGLLNFSPIQLLHDKQGSKKADVFGFEFKPYHIRIMGMDYEKLFSTLDSMNFTHYIVLDRTNRLRTIVSNLYAMQTNNKFHADEKEHPEKRTIRVNINKVRIDFEDKSVLQFLKDYDQQFIDCLAALGNRKTLQLTYENDIEHDPRKAYDKVCNFIDIASKTDIPINLKKTTPFPLNELIDNFAELKSHLSGTPYEWMLDD